MNNYFSKPNNSQYLRYLGYGLAYCSQTVPRQGIATISYARSIGHRGGSRIWVEGGPNCGWPKFADVMQRSHVSEASL